MKESKALFLLMRKPQQFACVGGWDAVSVNKQAEYVTITFIKTLVLTGSLAGFLLEAHK